MSDNLSLYQSIVESDRLLETIDTSPIYTWAYKNIILKKPDFSIPGRFDVNKSRYLIDIFDAIKSYDVDRVCFIKGIKVGGTMVADIIIPYYLVVRPSNILWLFYTNLQAEGHMEAKMLPLLNRVESIKPLLPHMKYQAADGVSLANGCKLWVVGATEANLQEKDCAMVICDESWQWDDDMLVQAEKRIDSFRRIGQGKFIVISQAGLLGSHLHSDLYDKGTCKEWSVPCEACNQYHTPMLGDRKSSGGLKFDTSLKHDNGTYKTAKVLESIYYECPHCKAKQPLADEDKIKRLWNNHGKYISKNPEPVPRHESFLVNGISVAPWRVIVEEFLSAQEHKRFQSKSDKLITFNQQRLCIPQYRGVSLDEDILLIENYDASSDFPNSVAKVLIVDIQNDSNGYWCLAAELAKDGSSRLLEYTNVKTTQQIRDIQTKHNIPNNRVFVDVGMNMSVDIALCAANHWNGMRGDKRPYFIWQDKTGTRYQRLFSSRNVFHTGIKDENGKEYVGGYHFMASSEIKDVVYNLYTGATPVKWLRPSDPVYLSQLKAEQRKYIGIRDGKHVYRWTPVDKVSGNHALDCEVMLTAVMLMYQDIGYLELEKNMYPHLRDD